MARARNRALRLAVVALSLLIGIAPAPPALAQQAAPKPAPASTAGNSAEYARTIAAAMRAFNLHHWDDALALFEQAHGQKPNARTLRGMGQCQYELHHYAAAASYLTQALIDSRSPLPPDQRNATADLLARASAAVGNVELQITPRDAELFIDGARVELPESSTLQLDPGHHELSAKAPGYELLIVQVEVASGSNSVTLALPASRRPVAMAAPKLIAPPPTASPAEAPRERRPIKVGLAVTGALIGVGGLVAAGATGLIALKKSDQLHDACPSNACPSEKRTELDDARKLALVSNVMWGVGALGVGVFLIGVLLPKKSKQDDSATTVQVGLGSVSLRGSF
jgi:hypothetical protein